MGWASEQWIEEFNYRYDTDAEFRREFDEQIAFEAWQEAEAERWWKEAEKQMEWFPDRMIDWRGEAFELPPEPKVLIDDDIPF